MAHHSNSASGSDSSSRTSALHSPSDARKVFVGGLAAEASSDSLRRHFGRYGDLLEATVVPDKSTGRSEEGYGFVTFRDPESARRACLDCNPIIDGRRANCNLASLGQAHPSPSSEGAKGRNKAPFYTCESMEAGGEESLQDIGGIPNLEWRFNQTLKSVQGLLKGRSFPGKVLLSRKFEPRTRSTSSGVDQEFQRSFSERIISPSHGIESSSDGEFRNSDATMDNVNMPNTKSSPSTGNMPSDIPRSTYGARATDTARVAKFIKETSATSVIVEKLRELAWSGVPPYMRPKVWRLLLGYASPNSDRRDGLLRRKRIEYMDCISHYYDIPDTEKSDDEINMLRQIAVDCPRTVPDVTFFQQLQVQKSLERILYTWAIRHPASGYVQGINDLVTPFLVVFLSEYLDGSMEDWSISDLSEEQISDVEADCYWCVSKLLEGMQDHYTFAQPGIQRLVFKLKELVRRIDEPLSKHMEDQGLEFLQFAFRWFNCLVIREIPFHLVMRLWDTYLAEGDALPDFLVYISASFLLTWSDKLQKLEFQEMVMFLQHLPTQSWTHQELEMVLSRAYMWHTMFNSSPSHLAS